MLDVFSRYVVGWMIAHRESAELAETFIRETCHFIFSSRPGWGTEVNEVAVRAHPPRKR